MILSESLSRAEHVWEATWHILSEDIENKKREEFNNPGLYYVSYKPVLIISLDSQ